MPRGKSSFTCRECGYASPGWLGRCPGCGSWNTIVEEAAPPKPPRGLGKRSAGPPAAAPTPLHLSAVDLGAQDRIDTGLGEFNRVLGGGLVAGSVVLVGGEPGVGKSTLLLQALLGMEAQGVSTLLISGEESPAQVKLRSARLLAAGPGTTPGSASVPGVGSTAPLEGEPAAAPRAAAVTAPGAADLRLLTETQTELVVAALDHLRPAVCVVDSVQTLWSAEVASTPGSIAQIRDATSQLLRVAKAEGIALVLVGHVTKEGELAGPRVLEHMVDTVLSFEGERTQPFRILRAVKNRFGSTNEVGVFQMAEQGLLEVPDPSSIFIEEGDLRSGSAVVPVLEGTRCLLAEVQALVTPSNLAMPQRVARGVDRNRLAMIVAVLSRRARLPLLKCDIFVNVAGGLVLEDPAADLAVALAVASAWRDGGGGQGVAAFGEVSLTGKIRYVLQGDKRVQELARRGFSRILIPGRNAEELSGSGGRAPGPELLAVTDIEQAVAQVVRNTAARSTSG